MMMRCLGGPNDGEWYDAELRFGDLYKVPVKSKFLTDELLPEEYVPKIITESYNLYRISNFYFSKDDVYWFLVPKDLTCKEAIISQLEKNYSDNA